MLDFFDTINLDIDVKYFEGLSDANALDWQTWHKPRGAAMLHILAVGGGGSGATGQAYVTADNGGAGGQSGCQTVLKIPAIFVPDTLYVQAGQGGKQPASLVAAANGISGTNSYVCIEPQTTVSPNFTLVFAQGGGFTNADSSPGTAIAATTLATMPLAGRGVSTFIGSQIGGRGANDSSGIVAGSVALPVTGAMVTAGGGGGCCNTTLPGNGITITTAGLGREFFNFPGGGVAGNSTNGNGFPGEGGVASRYFLMNTGGGGGGGTNNGISANGGIGAPGCGGGAGAQGGPTITTVSRPGDGGPGFVLIVTT